MVDYQECRVIWGYNILLKLTNFFPFINQVDRAIGTNHQAGSDSLLTLKLFNSLKTGIYKDEINLKEEFMVFGMDSESEYT